MTDLNSRIELYDHEIRAIDEGPARWLAEQQGRMKDLEEFRKATIGQFEKIGLDVFVKVYDTTESGTFAFEIEIRGRLDRGHVFDFDRQVHEVQNNLLQIPGEGGKIKTDPGIIAAMRDGDYSGAPHNH